MAVTSAISPTGDLPVHSVGDRFESARQVTFDNSYPTGGEPMTAAQFGMSRVTSARAHVLVPGSTGIIVTPLPQADGSLLLRAMTAAQVEVANASDQSALVCLVTAKGL